MGRLSSEAKEKMGITDANSAVRKYKVAGASIPVFTGRVKEVLERIAFLESSDPNGAEMKKAKGILNQRIQELQRIAK
jgi:hypothetical protein